MLARQGLVEECTASINRIRGLLTEFGLVFPQDPIHLHPSLAEITGERQTGQGLPDLLRLVLQRLHLQWLELEVH